MDEELHGGAHLALDLLRRRQDRVAGERAMMKRAAHQGEKLPRREDRIDELELPLLHLFGEIGGSPKRISRRASTSSRLAIR